MDKKIESLIGKFSAKLCNELDNTKNHVLSPLATEMTLGLLALGSTDPSYSELLNIIGVPNDDNIASSFLLVSSKLNSIKGVTLKIANKLYIRKGDYKINRRLKNKAKKYFNVGLKEINFCKSKPASEMINKWVQKKTKKKFESIFHRDSFNKDSDIIIISALKFKGIWKTKFDLVEETIFKINHEKWVNLFFMSRCDKYRYKKSEDLDAQLLQLPFKGDEAAMLIVLPTKMHGLDKVLQKLADGYNLMAEVSQMHVAEVEVSIPRFKIESEVDVTELLQKLDVNSLFDKHYSGITKIVDNNKPLIVSRAVQKVFIEINEKGGKPKPERIKGGTCIPRWKPKPCVFTADHPHLIIIFCHNIPIIWIPFRGRFQDNL